MCELQNPGQIIDLTGIFLATGGNLFFDVAQRALFQSAHLRLADPDLPRHLHLGFSIEIPHRNDTPFSGRKRLDGISKHNVADPAFLPCGVVKLIDQCQTIFSIRIDWFV